MHRIFKVLLILFLATHSVVEANLPLELSDHASLSRIRVGQYYLVKFSHDPRVIKNAYNFIKKTDELKIQSDKKPKGISTYLLKKYTYSTPILTMWMIYDTHLKDDQNRTQIFGMAYTSLSNVTLRIGYYLNTKQSEVGSTAGEAGPPTSLVFQLHEALREYYYPFINQKIFSKDQMVQGLKREQELLLDSLFQGLRLDSVLSKSNAMVDQKKNLIFQDTIPAGSYIEIMGLIQNGDHFEPFDTCSLDLCGGPCLENITPTPVSIQASESADYSYFNLVLATLTVVIIARALFSSPGIRISGAFASIINHCGWKMIELWDRIIEAAGDADESLGD